MATKGKRLHGVEDADRWAAYVPPPPCLTTCPTCHGGVLIQIVKDGAYIRLEDPCSPMTGKPHVCYEQIKLR